MGSRSLLSCTPVTSNLGVSRNVPTPCGDQASGTCAVPWVSAMWNHPNAVGCNRSASFPESYGVVSLIGKRDRYKIYKSHFLFPKKRYKKLAKGHENPW